LLRSKFLRIGSRVIVTSDHLHHLIAGWYVFYSALSSFLDVLRVVAHSDFQTRSLLTPIPTTGYKFSMEYERFMPIDVAGEEVGDDESG